MRPAGFLIVLAAEAAAKTCPMSGSVGRECPMVRGRDLQAPTGLLNEGRGCWGHCESTAGNCSYCGTGQCCRRQDYDFGVPGCELATNVTGARCGLWQGDPNDIGLKNEGRACMGHCDNTPGGGCVFCGTGQCCRRLDADRCVPGCELAGAIGPVPAPQSQCGNWALHDDAALDPLFCVPAAPPSSSSSGGSSGGSSSGSSGSGGNSGSTPVPDDTGLLREGQLCHTHCRLNAIFDSADAALSSAGGDCAYCGTGQCCTRIDWYRGVPGCELAENLTVAVCGHHRQPHPEPFDFRVGEPRGTLPTPPTPTADAAATGPNATFGWFADIDANGDAAEDHALPAYSGSGGQPWSRFEMALVRDLILREIRRATAGKDQISGARLLRLAFHDCLRYEDGTGGCDGCLDWEAVGTVLGGENGRVEDRELEDHERRQSNNGLQEAIGFIEYVYTVNLGQSWASGCWQTPATISGGTLLDGPYLVYSTEQCLSLCRNYTGCAQFTVPQLPYDDGGEWAGRGPCRLFSDGGWVNSLSSGRLIAGRANCTPGTPSWSLQSRGKSRADLVAFASLVAVEEGIARHNWACDGDRKGPHNGPTQCVQFEGEPGCRISPSRPLIFQTGRSDCVTSLDPPYKAPQREYHPDEHFNGTMAVRFMEGKRRSTRPDGGRAAHWRPARTHAHSRCPVECVPPQVSLASRPERQSPSWARTPWADSTRSSQRTSTSGRRIFRP